uniref:Uncharacterized protein n=1 Tax=Anguilla anguilla TaxID=7936 RepID=A0A0E9WY38_ANGAN
MRTTQDGINMCSISSGYSWKISTRTSLVLHMLLLYTSMKGTTSFVFIPPSLGMWAVLTVDKYRSAKNNGIRLITKFMVVIPDLSLVLKSYPTNN